MRVLTTRQFVWHMVSRSGILIAAAAWLTYALIQWLS